MKLSPIAKSRDQRDALLAGADILRKEQDDRRQRGEAPIERAQVFQRLVGFAQLQPKRPARAKSRPTFHAPSGAPIGEILSDSKSKGLTITINSKLPMDVDEILASVRTLLESAKFSRR